MAKIEQYLDGVEAEMAGSYKALPQGTYVVKIRESEYKPTRAGDGMVLKLEHEIVGESYTGRVIFDALTLEHPKQKVVDIARSKLKALALAVRHPTPDFVEDSVELHDVPFEIRLSHGRAANPQFADEDGFENRILAYEPIDGAPAPQKRPKSASPTQRPLPPLADVDDEAPF